MILNCALIPSPRRGRTKVGVISWIGSQSPLSRPFPIKGKGDPSKIETIWPHFSSSVGERKIMNHFVVKIDQVPHRDIAYALHRFLRTLRG